MNYIILIILFLSLLLFFYIINYGYPKHGWFKKLFHNKLGQHISDWNNLDYNENLKIATTECKYCGKPMVYTNVCQYLVNNNPKEIPYSAFNDYCKECKNKNYTRNKNCCPLKCEEMNPCSYCNKGCI